MLPFRHILTLILIITSLSLSGCGEKPADKNLEAPPPMDMAAFNAWVDAFKKEALAQGISQKTIDEAFAVAEPDAYVIKLDRKQPESTLTMDEYLAKTVTADRIAKGKQLLDDNQNMLEAISREYGVQPEYIVALWGIESNYGGNTGNYMVVTSLATLAFEGRRSEFFRGELMNALKILDEDHIEVFDMQGSWAGAMGQCQFMPSSFLRYAVDYDHDGKRDIWNSNADVFASIANYLKSEGWNGNREHDFNILLKWNRSRYFATAVGMLAENMEKKEVKRVAEN